MEHSSKHKTREVTLGVQGRPFGKVMNVQEDEKGYVKGAFQALSDRGKHVTSRNCACGLEMEEGRGETL